MINSVGIIFALVVTQPYFAVFSKFESPGEILLDKCRIQPTVNSPQENDTKTRVEFRLILDRFVEIDDVSETSTMLCALHAFWMVPCVAKVAREELIPMGVTGLTREDPKSYWQPNLWHRNAMNKADILKNDDMPRSLTITLSIGAFTLITAGTFVSQCTFNFMAFPFDKQRCDINILIMEITGREYIEIGDMQVIPSPDGFLSAGSNWDVIGYSAAATMKNNMSYGSDVAFTVQFRRHAAYYLLNLYAPSLILCILELSSFLVPANTPDRPAFACSIMLSVFVLRDQMLANLPKTPQLIVAAYFLLGETLFSMLIVIYAGAMCSYVKLYRQQAKHKTSIFGIKRYCVIDIVAFVMATIALALLNIIAAVAISENG